MRALVFAVGFCLLLTASASDRAAAAGMYEPGNEVCACPALVAEGTIPDTLNTLADIPRALRLAEIVEGFADGVRAMFGQIGPRTAQAEPVAAEEPPPAIEKPAEKAPKPKPAAKPTTPKKVKRPAPKL